MQVTTRYLYMLFKAALILNHKALGFKLNINSIISRVLSLTVPEVIIYYPWQNIINIVLLSVTLLMVAQTDLVVHYH